MSKIALVILGVLFGIALFVVGQLDIPSALTSVSRVKLQQAGSSSIFLPLPEDSFILPHRNRELGMLYDGGEERMRRAVYKLMQGSATLGFVGASCTEGMGGVTPWPTNLLDRLKLVFPQADVHMFNGARGGTSSSYMGLCVHEHVPQNADLIMVEFAVNDPSLILPPFLNKPRAGFERLLRRLMNFPNRPAVVILNLFRWTHPEIIRNHAYWENAEREFVEFATYYELPVISVKAATFHLLRNGFEKLSMDNFRNYTPGLETRQDHFYLPDGVHLGHAGSKATAELAIHYIQRVAKSLHERPFSESHEMPFITCQIPRPMIPNNWEPLSQSCFFMDKLNPLVLEKKGFEYINEAKQERARWGYVATTPGSEVKFSIDVFSVMNPAQLNRSSRDRDHTPAGGVQPGEVVVSSEDPTMQIQVMYLRSYEGMGRATIACSGGCGCNHNVINGNYHDHLSLILPHMVKITLISREKCVLTFRVDEGTDKGGHKVKIVGLVVTNVEMDAVFSNTAIDWVTEIKKEDRTTVVSHNKIDPTNLQQSG